MPCSCPVCGHAMIQRNDREGAGYVLRGQRLLVLSLDGRVQGKCPDCGSAIDLPLTYHPVPVTVPVKRER